MPTRHTRARHGHARTAPSGRFIVGVVVIAMTATFAWGPPAQAGTMAGNVPDAPTWAYANARSQGADLAWQTHGDGGLPITSVTATATPGGHTCTALATETQSCVLTGLTNGTNYQITVHATNEAGNSPESAAASITPIPDLFLGDTWVYEGDVGITTAYVPVVLSAPSSAPVTIEYNLDGWANTFGAPKPVVGVHDFVDDGKTKTLTFKPSPRTGLTPTVKHIPIKIVGDTVPATPTTGESLDIVAVEVANVTGASRNLLTSYGSNGRLSIRGDDNTTGQELGISSEYVPEGDDGNRKMRFRLTLAQPSTEQVDFTYQVVGEASPPQDVSTATCAKKAAPGVDCLDHGGAVRTGRFPVKANGTTGTTATITVTTLADADEEGNDQVSIRILTASTASGPVTLRDGIGEGVIINDDGDVRLPSW